MAGGEPAQKPRLGKLSEADERRLVEAAQQDRAHFGAVYEKYFEVVYSYVARRVRDRAATEDLTSEVFRKALAHLPRFKWTGAPFGAWLLRIAANLIADRAKRVAREDQPDSNEFADRGSSAQAQQTDLEAAERRAYVIRLVDELPEDQRRVVRMRFAEEKSIGEIAALLNRTEGAVKQLQFRAFQTLRAKLDTK
ncbi:MAG TPA: sigma-70 family RNA polymerase sigma factor [Pyrinomonadaceae bacterium]|jgi:RNA polymerase sigma-70 factor (ECF subfamily)|nr:sigma-70 family RNA polymerase sigma factor [Pyrinomonadaceae bacterium]